jgi:hypothetical protein
MDFRFRERATNTEDDAFAIIATDSEQALSKQPIAATSRFGTIKAKGLNIDKGGGTILFEGPATLVLPESPSK